MALRSVTQSSAPGRSFGFPGAPAGSRSNWAAHEPWAYGNVAANCATLQIGSPGSVTQQDERARSHSVSCVVSTVCPTTCVGKKPSVEFVETEITCCDRTFTKPLASGAIVI